jgi:hypothetical protein
MVQRKGRKQEKRLNSRRADYSTAINSSHPGQPKVDQRMGSGGYHRPGSNKK